MTKKQELPPGYNKPPINPMLVLKILKLYKPLFNETNAYTSSHTGD
jgi:hypothetical protein